MSGEVIDFYHQIKVVMWTCFVVYSVLCIIAVTATSDCSSSARYEWPEEVLLRFSFYLLIDFQINFLFSFQIYFSLIDLY